MSNGTDISADGQLTMTHAVDHYMDILHYLIVDRMYMIFKDMFTQSDGVMYEFQQSLKGTKDWNKSQIDSVVQNILREMDWSKDDFDNLITALFVGYSQMLTTVNLKNEPEDFVLRVPSHETFIHTIMVLSAQRIFKNPFIFQKGSDEQSCACYGMVEVILQKSCKSAIYTLLPLKPILHYSNKEPSKSTAKAGGEDSSENGSDYVASDSDSDGDDSAGQVKQIPLNGNVGSGDSFSQTGSGVPSVGALAPAGDDSGVIQETPIEPGSGGVDLSEDPPSAEFPAAE